MDFAELKYINAHLPVELKVFDDEDLKERFELCGGVPRYIFNNFSSYIDNYPQALSEVTIDQVLIKEMMDIDSVSHQIFALQVPENYYLCQLDFLSRKISAEVKEHLKSENGFALSLVVEEYYDGAISAINGSLFGDFELEKFVPNVQFLMQSLDEVNSFETVSIPTLSYGKFFGLTFDEVLWEPKLFAKLWIPISKCFPCIHGLLLFPTSSIALGLLFTVGMHHPVPRDALAKLNNQCRAKFGCELWLAYIVPDDNFDLFSRQGQTIKKRLCEPNEMIPCRQFKLKLL